LCPKCSNFSSIMVLSLHYFALRLKISLIPIQVTSYFTCSDLISEMVLPGISLLIL
jgi:hypothetical protein